MRPSYCLEDPFYSPLVCTRGQLALGELVAHLLLLWASPSVSVVQCIMQAISPVKSIAHFSPGKCIFQCLPSGSWKVRLKKPQAYFFLNKSSMSMQFLGAAKAGLVGASIRTLLLEATRQSRLPQSGGGVLEFSWDHACGAFQLIMPCGVLRDDALLRLPQLPRLPCNFGLLVFHGWVRLGDGVPKVHGMLHRH